jgi:DNA repair protein RadA/Sms
VAKTKTEYHCADCGWVSIKWVGRCGSCEAWGTLEESGAPTAKVRAANIGESRAARPISEVSVSGGEHRATGVNEFDRVLGGGLVPGAAILISGEPGVGKSTLLLEVAAHQARAGARVLYASAEESVAQIRLRAERTGSVSENLYVAAETDLAAILGQFELVQPQLLIVDSVQTVSSAENDGAAGMPTQVREVSAALIRLAKEHAVPLILVGHVTKDGSVAGPRTLEHLVDVVCQFEGDRQTSLRFIRSLKNRFGPTDEIGCFEMSGEGIVEVADPSALFLSEAGSQASGTCVTVTVEGRRALIAELQALVVRSTSPQPRRVTSGVDSARVAMLLAVLERRAGIKLSDHDVYVSTVGGVRITEPAADLAIAVALASAATDKPVRSGSVAFGEISLAGEIRGVTATGQRTNEAARLGYDNLIDKGRGSLKAALAAALG